MIKKEISPLYNIKISNQTSRRNAIKTLSVYESLADITAKKKKKIKFSDIYQSLIDKEISASEIMENFDIKNWRNMY